MEGKGFSAHDINFLDGHLGMETSRASDSKARQDHLHGYLTSAIVLRGQTSVLRGPSSGFNVLVTILQF